MKVYLDNNIVSAIAKDDYAAESGALDRLLKANEEGKLELVTSELTLREIAAYHGPSRPPVERIFRLLKKVPIVQWDELLGMHSYGDARTWINSPMIQNDPNYNSLLALDLETVDAQHIFVAANVFLTCDKGILRNAAPIGKSFKLTVQRPSEFIASERW